MLALQKDPRRRYASVAQFRDDIGALPQGAPGAGGGRPAKLPRAEVPAPQPTCPSTAASAGDSFPHCGHLGQCGRGETCPAGAARGRSAAQHRRGPATVRAGQKAAAERARDQTAVQRPAPNRRPKRLGSNVLAPIWSARVPSGVSATSARWSPLCCSICTTAFAIWPDSAPARRLVLAKAQQYLEMPFPGIGRRSATATRTGQRLRKNRRSSSRCHRPGWPRTAVRWQNYQKAFQLRQAIARRPNARSLGPTRPGFQPEQGGGRTVLQRPDGPGPNGLSAGSGDAGGRAAAGSCPIRNRKRLRATSKTAAASCWPPREMRSTRLRLAARASRTWTRWRSCSSRDRLVRRTLASTCAAFGNLLRHLNQCRKR